MLLTHRLAIDDGGLDMLARALQVQNRGTITSGGSPSTLPLPTGYIQVGDDSGSSDGTR